MSALDRHPELAISLERLQAILEQVEHHRRFSERRFIVQAHPEFRKALLDFMDRWPHIYAWGRDWLAVKDFVRHHRVLVEQTEDRPSGVRQALDKNRDLAASIRRLHEIQEIVTANARSADLFQAHPEFREAYRDFKERWPGAYNDHNCWLIEHIKAAFEADVGADHVEHSDAREHSPNTTTAEEASKDNRPENDESYYHFDPDRDSIAMVIQHLDDYLSNNEPEHWWWAEGLEWLQETVGLDFNELETRWKEFPVIIIPQHVSDKYSLDQPLGLFGYLTQIRLAFIIGADLAAIALCRATTELLIRFHYASNVPNASDSRKTKLNC
jgi:hypothetical protein